MSRFMTLPGNSGFGFDSGRSMVVIPVAKRCSVYLIAGGDLKVDVFKEPLNLETGNAKDIATVAEGDVSKKESSDNTLTEWERQQSIRKFTIEGKSIGRVYVRALLNDLYNFTLPLEIRVVDNGTFGQASSKGAIPQEFEKDLSKLSLKEAAVRVAEDQMHNEIGQSFQASGSGLYNEPFHLAWCGAFAHWCYAQAAKIKKVPNPFGDSNNGLLSPEKAIDWALNNPSTATILQYEGSNMYGLDLATGRKLRQDELKTQKMTGISASNPLERGDILLVMPFGGQSGHVAMVYNPPQGDSVTSIDGNQGSPSIKMVTRNLSNRIGTQFGLAFIHLHV